MSFVLLPVLDIVAERFAWSQTMVRCLIIALGTGFFMMLVIAWYHGERGAQRVTRSEHAILAVLVLLGGLVMWRIGPVAVKPAAEESVVAAPQVALPATPAAAAIDPKSVAVLPFENLSDDKGNAYFADGMQDLILTRLAAIGDLKVISRTSTEKYQSHPDNLKSVARQLGVATLLEGSVQKAGNQVLINVQLIDADTDAHLWAEVYTRTLDNIFGVEGEVAQKVADALKAKLSPADTVRVTAVSTQNPEAYDLYLRALAFKHRAHDQYALTGSEMPQAIGLLQQALSKDPDFALADAQLAQAHMYVYFFASDRSDARLRAAKDAADRALRLQPDLGEAHFAQALYWYWGFRDYARAHAELALARKTLPHDFDVEQMDAAIARRQGRWQQALDGLRQAQAYDPRNASPAYEIGGTYAQLRRHADADQAFAHSTELSLNPALAMGRQAWNTVIWKGDLAPMRAWLASLPPASEEHRDSIGLYFELGWLSRDYTAAAQAAQAPRASAWITLNGNTVLPRRLYLA